MIISEVKRIPASFQDSHRLLERGLERARMLALVDFGIDDCGHSDRVDKWDRSSCSIHLEFDGLTASGGMMGWEYTVVFKAWCECHDDEWEDEDE